MNYRCPPPGDSRRDEWICAIEVYQEFQHYSSIFVCEQHFEQSMIVKKKNKNNLAKGAIPNIFPAPAVIIFSCNNFQFYV